MPIQRNAKEIIISRSVWITGIIAAIFVIQPVVASNTLGTMGVDFAVFELQEAFALDSTISDQASCEARGGSWELSSGLFPQCTVSSLTINSGDTLRVPMDPHGRIVRLRVDSGLLDIKPGATLEIPGGSVSARLGSTVNNAGRVVVGNGFFEIHTNSIMNNFGEILNAGQLTVSGATLRNSGTITNNLQMINHGSIINGCTGSLANNAFYTGDPTVNICNATALTIAGMSASIPFGDGRLATLSATVVDTGDAAIVPTGTVSWETTAGSLSSELCTLTDGHCSIFYTPPTPEVPVTITATYNEDFAHLPSSNSFATPISPVVLTESTCQTITGLWDAGTDTCTVVDLSINDGGTLQIASGVTLNVIEDITVNPRGTLSSSGNINIGPFGEFRNVGTFFNNAGGTIVNSGDLGNGASFNNAGTINNNNGEIFNIGGDLATFTNAGEISGGNFTNFGILNNDCGGIIDGELSGNPVVNICDSDLDGVTEPPDNCGSVPNPDQADADLDGIGDACDPEYDGPILSIQDSTAMEGDGFTLMTFTVSSPNPAFADATFQFSTTFSGGSATPGFDYDPVSGIVTMPQGQTTTSITVGILGEKLNEQDETFFVTLFQPTNAIIADNEAKGTILNDDPLPIVGTHDVFVDEGDSGTATAQFVVIMNPPSGLTVTVDFVTVSDTAVAGEDFVAVNETLTFNPGDAVKIINVAVNGDTLFEGEERFFVELRNPVGVEIGTGKGTGTIFNDDTDNVPPTVTGTADRIPDSNGWYNHTVTITWTGSDSGGIASCDPPTAYSGPDGNSITLTGQCTDNAGNVGTGSITIKYDETAPEITGEATTLPNGNGWYNSDVTVHFTASDATSGIQSVTPDVELTSDGVDQSAAGTATDNAGNTASFTVSGIDIDKTAPAIAASPDRPANTNGWYNADVTFTFECDDGLSGVESCSEPETLSDEGAGQSASGSAMDAAGNIAAIEVSDINIDKTAPEVTFTRTPANENGWNNGDVTVHFEATDSLSGVQGDSFFDVFFTLEGAGQTTGLVTFTDVAGNSASEEVSDINIDKTSPEVTGAAAESPNENGWYNQDVTIEFSATDSLSGIDGPDTATEVISEEGGSQSASHTFSDLAGNSAEGTVDGINLDKTSPELTMPEDIEVFPTSPDGTEVEFEAEASDNLDPSPEIEYSDEPGSTFAIGTTTVNITATDQAGNSVTDSFTVTVLAPEEATEEMIEIVQEMELPEDIEDGLSDKLEAATDSIDSGRDRPAQNQLRAFINQVNAQTGKSITEEQAEVLIAAVQDIINSIS